MRPHDEFLCLFVLNHLGTFQHLAGVQVVFLVIFHGRKYNTCLLYTSTAPSHLEGMHLWNTPMEDWYLDDNGKSIVVADGTDKANVSSKDKSEYLRPFEKMCIRDRASAFLW